MDKGQVVGGIITVLIVCIFISFIGYLGYKTEKEKTIRNETMLNLIIENEKLKILQEQNR